jgi:hypothetical protein
LSNRFKILKQRYDEIGEQIRKLQKEQIEIRDLMAKECPHENLIRVKPDPFLLENDLEDDEVKYKCQDCFEYFTEEEVRRLLRSKE